MSPEGLSKDMVEVDDKNISFVPFAKATDAPKGFIRHIKDCWWAVHPERGLILWDGRIKAPQFNQNRDVVESLIPRLYPWAEARFMPSVFLPADPQDYCGH